MRDEKPFVVVLGRFTPIGHSHPTAGPEARTCERPAVRLSVLEDGKPFCRTVKIERIVPEVEP